MQHTNSRRYATALLLATAFGVASLTHAAGTTAPAAAKSTPADQADQATAAKAKNIPVETTKDAADDPATKLASVEVTGSRIRTLGEEAQAMPVFSLPQVELERRGVERLADIRWAIPQMGASWGFNDNLVNSGSSRAQTVSTSFNLRGMGGNSTLVLVDGRRIPHTGQEAPGGAGGREDFDIDGIPVSAIERIDILPEGAGAVYGSEAIAGVVNVVLKKNYRGTEVRVSYDNTFKSDVADLTASVTTGVRVKKFSTFLSVSYEKQNGMQAVDRWFSSTYDTRIWGSTSTSTSFLNSVVAGSGALSSTSSPLATTTSTLPGLTTNAVAIPRGSDGSTSANASYTIGGLTPYDSAKYATSIDSSKSRNFVWKSSYDYAPWAQLYLDTRWSQFKDDWIGAPISYTFTLPVGYPGNPFSIPVYLSKVFYDLPRPETKSTQENSALVFGVRGDLPANWRYDVSANWARNVVKDDVIATSFTYALLNAAMTSANKPILAYDSANGKNPNAAGVLESLMVGNDHKDTTDVYQYVATADGSVWSGWAGDIRTAIGGEADEEKVHFWREKNAASLSYLLTQPFSRKSTAGFGELTVPLLSARQHIPLVHRVEVGGAVRATDYSDVGSVTTPTYRAMFQPTKWLTFRISRSQGFKPPRLYDLQAPISGFTTTLSAANKVTDPLRGGETVLGTYDYTSGGNPTLNPERSVSKNGGVVLDVPGKWFKGLSFSVDYYQIDYYDKSGSTGLQTLLNYFPERIVRAAPTAADTAAGYAGAITSWDARNINLSWVKTKGWDYRVSYNRTFDFGLLSVNVAQSDPDITWTKSTPASAPSNSYGFQPKRTSASAFLSRGPWSGGVSVNHQAKYYNGSLTSVPYPSVIEWNPQVSYDFGANSRFSRGSEEWWARSLAGTRLSVTIVNVFNREPTVNEAANSRIIMDPRLRRYVVSATKKF